MKIGAVTQRIIPVDNPAGKITPKEPKELSQKDSVAISDEGRKRLAEAADNTAAAPDAEKLPLKLLKIRNKIEAGFYDLPHVKEVITEALSSEVLSGITETEEKE